MGKLKCQAIIYTRVSTTRQADEGVSLDAQIDRARAYCKGIGYDVADVFTDRGISGGRVDNRPGLQSALDAVCDSGGVLVVFSLTRLARSTRDTIEIAERIEAAGADLISLSESIDTTSAAGKMIFRMLAVLSEFERDQVSERTRVALAYKRSQGFKTGGDIPFGFSVSANGKLKKNGKEYKALELIHRLRAEGLPLRAIAAELQHRRVRTKRGRKEWMTSTISTILKRDPKTFLPSTTLPSSCKSRVSMSTSSSSVGRSKARGLASDGVSRSA